MSCPSTKPRNCGPMWLARRISAASRRVSSPFSSSDPTLSKPMDGAVRPSTVRANTSPMMANCTRLRTSHCTLAPRSSITSVAAGGRSDGGHGRPVDTPAASSARSWPSVNRAHRCCLRRRRRRLRRRPLRRSRCASRIAGRATAAVGFMSPVITSAACRTVQAAPGRGLMPGQQDTDLHCLVAHQQEARLAGWRSAANVQAMQQSWPARGRRPWRPPPASEG